VLSLLFAQEWKDVAISLSSSSNNSVMNTPIVAMTRVALAGVALAGVVYNED
jgi:hypothetical protein